MVSLIYERASINQKKKKMHFKLASQARHLTSISWINNWVLSTCNIVEVISNIIKFMETEKVWDLQNSIANKIYNYKYKTIIE